VIAESTSTSSNCTSVDEQQQNGNTGVSRGIFLERRERKFVSKERQLEKLRSRLCATEEGASDICKNCHDEMVSL
jgi:hypothetical protein